MGYTLESEFNMLEHKKTFPHYLEVVMFSDGRVEYAVPSHQEKLIAIACRQMGVTREELYSMVPPDYYFDVIPWLCSMTGCISLWTDSYMKSDKDDMTHEQLSALKELKALGIYEGVIQNKAKTEAY